METLEISAFPPSTFSNSLYCLKVIEMPVLFCSGCSHLKYKLAINTNNFNEFKAEDKHRIMDHITQGSWIAESVFFDPVAFAMVNIKQKYGELKMKHYLIEYIQDVLV